jgi:hypothetical protein
MLQLRKTGLKLCEKSTLKASETKDGRWVAWLEVQGIPLNDEIGKPRLFEGHTRYQAQCAAYRWYFPDPANALISKSALKTKKQLN